MHFKLQFKIIFEEAYPEPLIATRCIYSKNNFKPPPPPASAKMKT